MRRGDITVFSISTALATVVVALVAFSLLVVNRWPSSTGDQAGTSTSSLLVLAWAPNLCKAAPFTPGCPTGHVDQMGRTVILHGLWPQPPDEQYCGVPRSIAERRRSALPPLPLSQDVQTKLQPVLSDVSSVAPYEWYKHGTCSDVTPALYFSDAAALTQQARQILDPMFEQAKGQRLPVTKVREQFDAAFGEGASSRVGLQCLNAEGEGPLIFEVRLSLPRVADLRTVDNTPNPGGTLSLPDLIGSGPTISAGCRLGGVL